MSIFGSHLYPLKMSLVICLHGLWFPLTLRLCVQRYANSNSHSSRTRQIFLWEQRITWSDSIAYKSKARCHLFQSCGSIRYNNTWFYVCVLYIRMFCVCRLVYVHQMLQRRTLSKTPLVTKGPTHFEKHFVSFSVTWSIYFGFFSSCMEFHFTGVKPRKEK